MNDNCIAPDVFDRLLEAMKGDRDGLAELYCEFLTEGRRTVAKLRKAASERQAEQLRNSAHYLKGSSQVVGARILAQCCTSLEQKGRNSDFSEVEQLLGLTVQELERVESELTTRLGPTVLPARGSAA